MWDDVQVIRGLATGKLDSSMQSLQTSVAQQARVGLVLGTALSLGGFLRVYLVDGNLINASAISMSLLAIVMTSVILGSALPFVLARVGIDPANAGTSIQVVMDIFGVGITCMTCDFVFRQFLESLA
jgi:Mg/Co/Ni transporter MgtE